MDNRRSPTQARIIHTIPGLLLLLAVGEDGAGGGGGGSGGGFSLLWLQFSKLYMQTSK